MKRSTKSVLFNVAKAAVVGCYLVAAYGWARMENPWKKGGILDDEKELEEKEEFEKEFEEINKRWEEANEKIKNKE